MADKKKVTQADYARHVGVSEKTVSEWKYAGWLVMTRSGGVNVAASDARLAERPENYRGGQTRGPCNGKGAAS